ncbi:MAG: PKD domain-containing protein, partial [Opitutaceae bacterium]|nr:PKD domain-containing protein [Verrucomicrobiales bacterium]
MKMFRWPAAGVMVILLAVLFFWKTSRVRPAQSLSRPATSDQSQELPVAGAKSSAAADSATSAPGGAASIRSDAPAFENWVRQYSNAGPAERAVLLAKGAELAKARRAEMAELIRNDPEQAIAQALPYALRKHLPESIRSSIEQPVSGRGDFRPVCYTPTHGNPDHVHRMGYEVEMNKTRFTTFTYGDRLHQPRQESAYLHGVSVPASEPNEKPQPEILLALSPDPVRLPSEDEVNDLAQAGEIKPDAICGACGKPASSAGHATVGQFGTDYYSFCTLAHALQFSHQLQSAHGLIWGSAGGSAGNPPDQLPPTAFSGTQGIKKLLYIRVTFADDPISPESDNAAQATVAANNRYFNEGSYNTVWWESTVTPLVRLPQRKNYYGENPGALLGDAAVGAAALGFFTTDYYPSYYVLHNTLVQYNFGGLSSGILNASPGALSHELGHNFGLPHANFWQPEGRFPGPTQPPNPQPPFPIDPDSLIGHYDVNAPFSGFNPQGTSEPILHYGNLHDVMGSGPGHFGVIFKSAMNWLPQEFIKTVTASTTNRIYAFDTPRISPGRLYAMRIHKNFQREYWVSYRQGFPDNPWFSNGLELDWLQAGGNVLLDTTPNTTFARQDAALVVGRTFSDPEARLHITPIALGGGPNPSDKWIDTVVQFGPFPDNQLPTLTLAPEAISVSNGATITFTATAQDPDGDQLAYYWDFGDYTFGSNSPVQTKTFNVDGQFVVRCEVSDMKGGRASANVVILVGTPTTFTISGRVLDIFGQPVQGVRVHNSGLKPNDPEPSADGITTNSAITDIGTYRYGFTDSQGYYVIGNVPPGVYTNRAFLFGYRTEPFDFTDPVDLNNGNANNLNFIATPLARVNVVRTRDANEPGASEDDDGIFTVSREGGDFSSDLKVRFRVGGTAFVNTDYVLNPVESITNVVTRTNNGVVRTFTNV